MYSSKYANISGNAVSGHYYCDGESKATTSKTEETVTVSKPLTIFDMPEFVVDAYLDAINGGSSEHAGFRSLSGKYGPVTEEGNYNCNHGPDPCNKPANESCGCGKTTNPKDYDGACGSLFEQSSGCSANKKSDSSPYEEGENAFIEPLKVPKCGCDCDPYEEGAFPFKNDYKPPKVNTQKPDPKKCSNDQQMADMAKRYPIETSTEDAYTEGENCALCVRDQ